MCKRTAKTDDRPKPVAARRRVSGVLGLPSERTYFNERNADRKKDSSFYFFI